MATDLQPLFVQIRQTASSGTWSSGVELARGDAVDGIAAADEEVTLRVKSPGRTVAPEVTLYVEYEEWDCTCDSTADVCQHVVASIIALRRARKEGQALPSSKKVGGRVGYRLSSGDRLTLDRVVGEEVLTVSLAGILSGREQGPDVEPSKVDLSIDRLLGQRRVRNVDMETARALLPLLADAEDVQLDGESVSVDAAPLAPKAIVRDGAGGGYTLRLERRDQISKVAGAGVVLFDGVLRPLDLIEITGASLEQLPREVSYARERSAELVTEVLPRLRERGEVDVQSSRLPKKVRALVPRVVIDVQQRGGALCAMPLLVYGDPPCARVDGDKLVHLGGPMPKRDRRAEERENAKLRASLDMVAGRRVEETGGDAIALAKKLRGFDGHIDGDVHRTLYPEAPLAASLGDDMQLSFGGADPAEVIRAWERGDDAVPLIDGGWAEIPHDWLATHGDRVAALLASRGNDEPHARVALAQLCDALERPRPPALDRLAPLIDGFSSLPKSTLPDDVTATLRDYQRRGVDWLSFLRQAGMGAVLADDMGLGKTLQALCALRGRSLVVCPRSVVHNWVDEMARFRPTLTHSVYHGQKRALVDADVTLTTYALLRNDIEALAAERWACVVLDESQAIKNPDSQVARAAFELEADFRITLSGTPVENRLEELWSQMNFANRGLLGGREDFAQRFERPMAAGDANASARLRERIKPFVLRRKKSEVLSELPPRTDAVMHCELEAAERDIYQAVLLGTRDKVVKQLAEGGNVMGALEALLRLRQAACDAYLVPGQASAAPDVSSKIRRLLAALDEAAADGHKALVFSQWTSLLDRVEPLLAEQGIASCRLDGSTRDRAGVVASFQSAAGPPVMLLSLKAGGTGLNLTAADHVFLLDPWWNPAVEDQAADRAHRIGQDKPVMVYRLVAKDTVEERILDLQEKKRALAEAALGEAAAAVAITRDDLLELLV